jgi:signal transduction histidine kinase
MRFHTLFFILLGLIALTSSNSDDLYRIPTSDTVSLLDSKIAGDWEASNHKISPEEYYNEWEAGIDKVSWVSYSIPGNLSAIFPPPYSKSTKFFIKKEFIVPESWSTSHKSLRLGQISDRDKTYLNGVLIGATGKMNEEHTQADGILRIYEIPENLLRIGKKNLLLIEVQNFYSDTAGIIRDEVKIGSTSLIYKEVKNEDNLKLFFIIVYSVLSIVFIFTYLFRKENKEYLFFSIFILNYVYYQVLQLQSIYTWGLQYRFIEHISYIFAPFLFLNFSHFISRYFNYNYGIVHKILDFLIITSRIVLIFILDIEIQRLVLNNFIIYLYLIYLILYFYWIFKRAIQKNKDAIYMSVAMLIFSVGIIFDLMVIIGIINFPKIGNILFVFFIFGLAIILAVNIEFMEKNLKELNINLEKKVVQRSEELKQSYENIKKLKSREDNLFYILGNSLKKSVTSIKDFSKLLLQYENISDDERLNILNLVLKESEELNISLENLIIWAKIQSNRVSYVQEEVSLKELVTDSIGIHKEFAFQKKIKLKFEVQDVTVTTDPKMLGFILRKLFSNSLKFTQEGGQVSLNGRVIDQKIQFTLKDTGVGIEGSYLKKLMSSTDFETDLSVTDSKPNLGLKICNRFIKFLDGNLYIQSDLGMGTEISILVPNHS